MATSTSSVFKRKLALRLSPVETLVLDVAHAARLGVDISYMAPDQRCKYPSKFCCNPRVKKTTGKLHRFCEEHRARAKLNQKRWTELRRRQGQTQTQTQNSLAAKLRALFTSDAWNDPTKPLLAPAPGGFALQLLTPLVIPAPRDELDWLLKLDPSSPTNVDVDVSPEEEFPLSEYDIDTLTSFVAQCEHVDEPMSVADARLMAMLQEEEDDALRIKTL